MRCEAVNRRLNGRRRDQFRLIAVAPGVQDLQGDFAALFVNRVGNDTVMCKLARIVQHRATFHRHA